MPGFDIESLLRFSPPQFLCERCCGLLNASISVQKQGTSLCCPVCGVAYVPTEDFPTPTDYLKSRGLEVRFHDLFGHSRKLAHVAHEMRRSLLSGSLQYPPMRALMEAMYSAEQFIHFTTYGISALLLGGLKMAAQRVDVRGIVSGIKHDSMVRELTDFRDEAPRLHTRVFQNEGQYFPHQKIIVIDGLLAFKGSANMTDFGWRKAAQGREVIEVVTDVNEVIDLHNRYFSPVWASFETPADEDTAIVMSAY